MAGKGVGFERGRGKGAGVMGVKKEKGIGEGRVRGGV